MPNIHVLDNDELPPRVNKTTAAKVAALRTAAEANQESSAPVEIPAQPAPVPDKAARALAKLFRYKTRLPSV